MSILEHTLFFLILLSFYFFWGKYNNNIKENYKFWISAIIPILLYSLILGSRYDWGLDYLIYKTAFLYPDSYKDQLVFYWIMLAVKWAGLDYVGFFIVLSLIFMTCAFVLLRGYGHDAKYMYAYIIPASLLFVNWIPRQGLACSFVLLAIYFLKKNKWIGVSLSIVAGAMVHTAILIPIAIIAVIYLFFRKQPISWKITLPIYFICTYFLDASNLGDLSQYIQLINIDGRFQNYINNADQWFSSDALNTAEFEQSFIAELLTVLFVCSIFYIGYQALKIKPNKNIIYLYNVVVFGLILHRIFFMYEIFRRFTHPLQLLYFIPLGYAISVFVESRKNGVDSSADGNIKQRNQLLLYRISLFFILVYLLLYWGRFIFMRPDLVYFWNVSN